MGVLTDMLEERWERGEDVDRDDDRYADNRFDWIDDIPLGWADTIEDDR